MCFQFQALAFRPFAETRCWLDLRSDNLSFEKIQIQVRQGGFARHTLYLVAAVAVAAAAAGKGTSATVVAAVVVVAGAALRTQASYAGRRWGPSGPDSCRRARAQILHC